MVSTAVQSRTHEGFLRSQKEFGGGNPPFLAKANYQEERRCVLD